MDQEQRDLSELPTEAANDRTADLGSLDARGVVDRLLEEELRVAPAVARAAAPIAALAERVAEAIRAGGRLIYAGAGTSGRLGTLDAAECPPTFGIAADRVIALMAGGPDALVRAVEGAEDDPEAARAAVTQAEVGANDVLVGITASGRTPYALAAIEAAAAAGATTALITCGRCDAANVDVLIPLELGPEALRGSTRLKAGTATKLALNALSTAAMARLGRVHGDLMIDVGLGSEKLRDRATRIVAEILGCERDEAATRLTRAGSVRAAVEQASLELAERERVSYPKSIRDEVRKLGTADAGTICRMNFTLGEYFARAALTVIREAGLEPDAVDLIGSHGQTVFHVPPQGRQTASTLQIGEADVIAERTGAPVVSDFRTRDIAAGGQGAPLVAYVDHLLFHQEDRVRLRLNIGGIANVTVVTPAFEDLMAFDTGPGNSGLDTLVGILSRGEKAWDEDGRLAARGRIDENLLARLMAHPYLNLPPPKSTGRETFGLTWVESVLRGRGNIRLEDVLATLTMYTAQTIHFGWTEWVKPKHQIAEVILSGGGARNLTLLAHLRRLFRPIPVRGLEEFGHDPDAAEAVAFAILANETLHSNPSNVPSATGARWPAVLGKLSL